MARKYFLFSKEEFETVTSEKQAYADLEAVKLAVAEAHGQEFVLIEEAGVIAPKVNVSLNYKPTRTRAPRKPKEAAAEGAEASTDTEATEASPRRGRRHSG